MRVFFYPSPDRTRRSQTAHNTTHTPDNQKKDRCSSGALTAPQPDKINLSPTKSALHRTRLHILDHKNFSVLFFYKPDRQGAHLLAACVSSQTEKIEKNFSVFQFEGSAEGLSKTLNVMKHNGKLNFM